MSSKYWIKLYHEILDDPKMGMLPDNLWRRTIELFLLAGELSIDKPEDDRGGLPPTQELAWRLRRSAAELDQELEQLARINIVTRTETGWIVTKFAERQKAVPAVERMRQLRERKHKDNPLVTKDKDIVTRNVTKSNIDIESDIDTDSLSATPTPAIPSKKAKPKIASPKEQGLFLILARLCRIDLKTAPLPKQIGQLDDTVKALLPAIKDCTFFAVKFETYWTTVDWRGKQGQPPTPPQIREVYGDYCYWLEHGEKRATSANGNTPPPKPSPLTPEQKAAARALNSDHQAAVAETTQRVNGLLAAGVTVAGVDIDRELRKPTKRSGAA